MPEPKTIKKSHLPCFCSLLCFHFSRQRNPLFPCSPMTVFFTKSFQMFFLFFFFFPSSKLDLGQQNKLVMSGLVLGKGGVCWGWGSISGLWDYCGYRQGRQGVRDPLQGMLLVLTGPVHQNYPHSHKQPCFPPFLSLLSSPL